MELPTKGNPHVRTRVDPVMKRFLRGYAAAHDTTIAQLVREVLAEWVYERVDHTPSKRVDHTLRRLDVLFKQFGLRVAMLPGDGGREQSGLRVRVAGEVKVPGGVKPPAEKTPPRLDAEKEREEMYWLVVALLKEAQKLAGDEELAKKAGSRMDAMKVAANLTRLGEAILAGYERAYIQPTVDELESLIEQLKEKLKQTDQKGQESASAGANT
jgi:hypothetical protein